MLKKIVFFATMFAMVSVIDADQSMQRLPVRGVNLGGWLVLEGWMTTASPVFQEVKGDLAGTGEYIIMKHLGHEKGDPLVKRHRDTFITEQDFQEIANSGFDFVRIPVGYWLFDHDYSDPSGAQDYRVFTPGALSYLDQAIKVWAKKYNLGVLISIHGAKGSQNGQDHSAPVQIGKHYWIKYPENVINALQLIGDLVDRYRNDQAFYGIGLINEPVHENNPDYLNRLRQYYNDAYNLVRNEKHCECILTFTEAFNETPEIAEGWKNFLPNGRGLLRERHSYYIWGFEHYSPADIVQLLRTKEKEYYSKPGSHPYYVGEWSSGNSVGMNLDQVKEFTRAQVEAFGHSSWTFWNWKLWNNEDETSSNGWSMKNMLRHGVITRDLINYGREVHKFNLRGQYAV